MPWLSRIFQLFLRHLREYRVSGDLEGGKGGGGKGEGVEILFFLLFLLSWPKMEIAVIKVGVAHTHTERERERATLQQQISSTLRWNMGPPSIKHYHNIREIETCLKQFLAHMMMMGN